ncbi:MAG: hypothetical protein Tsb0014_15460 [Pleurocapsa sp.]
MIITDLSYLESISDATKIEGSGAGVATSAYAGANGDDTLADTQANTRAKDYGVFQVAWGTSKAVAIGDSATTDTSATGFGKVNGGNTYNSKWKIGNKELAIGFGVGWGVDW